MSRLASSCQEAILGVTQSWYRFVPAKKARCCVVSLCITHHSTCYCTYQDNQEDFTPIYKSVLLCIINCQLHLYSLAKKKPNFCYNIFTAYGTFLEWHAGLFSHCPGSPIWFENNVLSRWISAWGIKSLLGLGPEIMVDGHNRSVVFH